MHEKIVDLETFVETFLYLFSQGSNAEFVSINKELFFDMLDILEGKNGNTPIPIREEIGGHSSVWVIRAQYENCGSYSTPYPSEFNKKNLVVDDSQRVILPYEHMQVKEENPKLQDVHFVFEYVKGDKILEYEAPRSNRFYFVHDPNGASLT